MFDQTPYLHRRRFLKVAIGTGALVAMPRVIPGAVLGKDGNAPPSERIVVGGIGIGGQGSGDLGCFLQEPDVQVVATCDVRAERRAAVKGMVDRKYGNENCIAYRDFRELLARGDIDAVLILDCVKSRGQPRASAEVACQTHIACHAANIALFLKRKLAYDPKKNEFVDDAEANRLRGEALREPWRV